METAQVVTTAPPVCLNYLLRHAALESMILPRYHQAAMSILTAPVPNARFFQSKTMITNIFTSTYICFCCGERMISDMIYRNNYTGEMMCIHCLLEDDTTNNTCCCIWNDYLDDPVYSARLIDPTFTLDDNEPVATDSDLTREYKLECHLAKLKNIKQRKHKIIERRPEEDNFDFCMHWTVMQEFESSEANCCAIDMA